MHPDLSAPILGLERISWSEAAPILEKAAREKAARPASLSSLRARVRASWSDIVEKAGVRENPPRLPRSIKLLGSGTKTEKGEARGHLTAILYAAPAFSLWGSVEAAAGRTLCPFATGNGARVEELESAAGCIDLCLAQKAGRMPLESVSNSRRWKAALLVGARSLFLELLRAEAQAFEKAALRKGYVPVVRVDGGTDTGIGAELAPILPRTRVYDYTKVGRRARKFAAGRYAPNYHVTFSWSGRNELEARELLAAGVNLAVVFVGRIPREFLGAPTYSADEHDLRFLDAARGGIAALTLKSLSRVDAAAVVRGGFVVDADADARASRD